MVVSQHTFLIKKIANELGFDFCGISKAGFLEDEAGKLEKWLNNNYHGEMAYMANHFDKRTDPTKLVEGAKSVVSLLLNYYPEEIQNEGSPKISKYAYGKDYHLVIKEKLFQFMERIREEIGEVGGRVFVDSAPVMDKVWAAKSGLGWIGKHSNLINKNMGSFFFIAELILDIELEPDAPIKDYCGSCTRCIDACPTNAITEPYVVDGSKCISYFTIELKKEIPESYRDKFDDWAFGCDICQDVCPWNRFSKPGKISDFHIKPEIQRYNLHDWKELTEEVFNKVFKDSPLKRTGYDGMMRNIKFISKSSETENK